MAREVAEVRAWSGRAGPARVAEALGLERAKDSREHWICPAHGGGALSLRIGDDGTLQAKCFACDFGGDILSLVAAREGLDTRGDFRKVLGVACELAGITMSERGTSQRPRTRQMTKRSPSVNYPPASEVVAVWESAEAVDVSDGWHREMLTRRFGEAGKFSELLRRLTGTSPRHPWCSYWHRAGYTLVAPLFDVRGELRSLRAWGKDKRVAAKGCSLHGLVLADQRGREMLAGRERPTRLVIAEGEPDWLTWTRAAATSSKPWATFGIGSGWWTRELADRVPDGCEVIVATDGDVTGDRYAAEVAATLAHRCTVLRQRLGSADDTGKRLDANDLWQRGELPADPAEGAFVFTPSELSEPNEPGEEWRERLSINGEGRVRKTLANTAIVLEHHPDWQGVLGYDEFRGEVSKRKPAPMPLEHCEEPAGPWADVDALRAAAWLETEIGLEVTQALVADAATLVAHAYPFHPVRDYFNGLEWDGTARLDAWLVTYAGADDNDYTRGVGARWMISAVARTFEPGCQVDCVLVLEGPQGIKKSTLLRTLAGREWFSELGVVGEKDTLQGLRGKLLLEMAELASMKGRSREKVKAFLTTHVDTYRPSYGRIAVAVPRQCVFAATTNDQHYLEDPTGNRRFWPVRVRKADVGAAARDRDQLWAEAVHRYKAGEAWHVDTEELRVLCEAEQAEREIGDSWDEELRAWLARPVVLERTATGTEARVVDISKGVKPSDALRGILGPDSPKAPRSVEMRLAECFRRLGYEQTLLSVGKARPRVWRPKTDRTDQRSTSFPKLPESVQQCAVQHSAAPPTPSLSTLPIKVDRVDRVDQTLGNQDSKFDQPPINHQPKVDQNGQSGTKQYLGAPHPLVSSALELPESFFEGTDFASEVDRNSEPANAVEALACTCLAGAGEPHADWCGEQRGAAE